ncbi:hypothetical protein JZ785_14395 [Alicyclobacillus curvatus]|nr:hypothetical protein JZ785_14395 [Alicyclobacillus curvatus]
MLHLVKENIHTDSKKTSEIVNPVATLWDIELFYGKHPNYTECTYSVNFTTKLEGHASRCYLVIDLREHFDEYLRELNVFGSIEKSELHKTIEYIKQLKINGIFKRVPNLLSVMEGKAGSDESLELFELVMEAVQSDPDAFPSVSSNLYKHRVSSGVVLDTDQYITKYGHGALAITTEALLEILNLDEGSTKSIRFMEITRGFLANGYLLKRNRGPRLQEPIRPNLYSKEVKRFYVFKGDGTAQDA